MSWWIWVAVGLALIAAEFLTPGFVVIFFGIASLLIGIAVGAGAPLSPTAQWALFSVISILSLLLFRKRLEAYFKPSDELQRSLGDLVGGVAVSEDAMAPGAIGRAAFRGADWSARNIGEREVGKGERCTIEKVDGLMLLIKPVNGGPAH